MSFGAVAYIVTAVISIAIAVFLVYMARASYNAKLKEAKGKEMYSTAETATADTAADEDLREDLYNKINEAIGSNGQSRKVGNIVSNIFTKELEKKIEQNNQELGEKYDKIIEQKSQNEEIAWKKYKKVLANKKETEAVIRSISDGLVVADSKGNVVMMNPAAEKLLGVSKKDKIGKHLLNNLKEGELVTLAKGSVEDENMEIESNSEEEETRKILRSSSAVVEDENGQTVGMVSVLSDITKQKELDEMKTRFVSSVTHELRTPLVSAQKSISLILSKTAGRISEDQQQFLSNAERNLSKLSRLIDDLLDMSKLEAGKLEVKREAVSIEKVIRESMDGLNAWAISKSINIKSDIQKALPEVKLDTNRINHLLNNLIGNAIKFTPNNGKIIVRAILNKDNEIEVSVTDTGIGIAKDDLPKVFGRFYQTGERIPTDISGTGIGLSVAKEVVGLHGGRIWAESEEGKGAKFIFTLPVKQG